MQRDHMAATRPRSTGFGARSWREFHRQNAPGMVAPEEAVNDGRQLHSATESMALNEDDGKSCHDAALRMKDAPTPWKRRRAVSGGKWSRGGAAAGGRSGWPQRPNLEANLRR